MSSPVQSSLLRIIRNDDKLYEGDLLHYFRIVFRAQNVHHPYHNFRHMLHVTWLCYQACVFYQGPTAEEDSLTPRQMRDLLVAAIFHDFDHPGILGNDDLNVERSLRSMRKHLMPVDRERLASIETIVHATEFPYKSATSTLPLMCQIIRDADMGQSFSNAWVQQVIFGLAAEWGEAPYEIFKRQLPFLAKLRFHTAWGKKEFPQEEIEAKVREVEGYLAILG